MRIIGLDPGLQRLGWGIIEQQGSRLSFVACGVIASHAKQSLPARLAHLYNELEKIVAAHAPQSAAVEETFVNTNPASALKLGQARAVALLVPARAGLQVGEYAANTIKKAVVGVGHAEKHQIQAMVKILLPASAAAIDAHSNDAADALAVAICHAHHGRIV